MAGTGIFHRVSGNQAFVYGSLHAVAYPCYEDGGERWKARKRDEEMGGSRRGWVGDGEEVRATEKRNVYSTAWN